MKPNPFESFVTTVSADVPVKSITERPSSKYAFLGYAATVVGAFVLGGGAGAGLAEATAERKERQATKQGISK